MSLPDWHPADVIAALKKKGIKLRKLSLDVGLNPAAASSAILRPGFSRRLEGIIADRIGEAPEVIWPSRYANVGDGLNTRHKNAHCQPRRNRLRARGAA